MIGVTRALSATGSHRCRLVTDRISTPVSMVLTRPSASRFHGSTKNSAKVPPSKAPQSSKKARNTTPAATSVSSSSTSTPAPTPKTTASSGNTTKPELDPHEIASNMVRDASDSRIAGTEALASLSQEAKLRNYGTALVLAGFCTSVWWYSIQSVGRAEGGIEDLQAEANEAREGRAEREISEGKMEELAGLDVTMNQMSGDMEGVEVAVAAEAEIAQMEEDLNSVTNGRGGESKRPLWKKIVFFWRRD